MALSLTTPPIGLALLLAVGLSGLPCAAGAQHPVPSRGRPFHQRVPQADSVAVVQIDTVDTGRIEATLRSPMKGTLPERFQIKRAPSRPPALEAGDLVVLMLKGARPPYVLPDVGSGVIRIPNAEAERSWTPLLREAVMHPTRGEALAPLYLTWIDQGADELKESGLRGLLDPEIDTELLRNQVAMDRALAAADPQRSPTVRRISAILAVRTADGTAALLPEVARDEAQAPVVASALRGGAVHDSPGTRQALDRALNHQSAPVREAALFALPSLSRRFDDLPLEQIAEMARSDPDPGVRRRATRVLRSQLPVGER